MTRTKLSARRPAVTALATWKTEGAEHRFHVSVGFDPRSGAIAEVWYADGQKTGTALRASAQDACILVSLLLQHGVSVEAIGKSLNRATVFGGDHRDRS
jgi:hypothetical protein